ncbi:hypothetical protein AURDEDRAFT_171172 [Auricularia subglabra TFB-10046 SS5]|uniref:Uncharacterized protein n=1 Tax=Auricularia subglabra (strain TFB-10046 / SS5) TaxID=717982 RepID=J0WXL3_AURST|nr:hypothetical protein AURDEDRAFT_171172 [Auricularia subglabra TFB-10046 SS5]
MPGLCTRLEYSRMDNETVLGLLQCDAEFRGLWRVRIDVSNRRPPGSFSRSIDFLREDSARRDFEGAPPRARTACADRDRDVVGLRRRAHAHARFPRPSISLPRAWLGLQAAEKPALELCPDIQVSMHAAWELAEREGARRSVPFGYAPRQQSY